MSDDFHSPSLSLQAIKQHCLTTVTMSDLCCYLAFTGILKINICEKLRCNNDDISRKKKLKKPNFRAGVAWNNMLIPQA